MSTMMRNQFQDAFFQRVPFIDHTIMGTYDMYPEQYSKFFKTKSSGRAFENVTSMIGTGYLVERGEDEAVSYDRIYQGPKAQFIHTEYALALRTSQVALEDDIDGILKQGAMHLGRSARYTPEMLAAVIFNSGETAAAGLGVEKFTAPRGEALFSATHAMHNGGTYSNLGAADFGITSLRAALNNIARVPDERGKLVRFTPDRIVGSPEMQYIFQEILNSDGKSGTADNDLNAFRVLFSLRTDEWHYLNDLDAWYLLCTPAEHELWFFWRKAFETSHDTDWDTGGAKSKIRGRMSCGYAGWRGTYASTP